jgi:ATP-dependent Clp protease ATP-binding subunit ClpA
MRDFRNAKAMAQTLRAALAAKGIKITVGQSLELMAVVRSKSFPPLSGDLSTTLHRAIGFASQRNHEYATLEHLLLALVEDADASASISACNANPNELTERLVDYLDYGLTKIVMESHAEPKPTAAFQRVVQRAEVRRKAAGRSTVTGVDTLEAIFYETESPAARLLAEQGITYQQLLYSGGTGRR